jgi:hypothetical protein
MSGSHVMGGNACNNIHLGIEYHWYEQTTALSEVCPSLTDEDENEDGDGASNEDSGSGDKGNRNNVRNRHGNRNNDRGKIRIRTVL